MGEAAGLLQLVEGELRPVVARVELLGAEVDGVGPVGEGGTDGVEGARGGKQLWNWSHHGAQNSAGRLSATGRAPCRATAPAALPGD